MKIIIPILALTLILSCKEKKEEKSCCAKPIDDTATTGVVDDIGSVFDITSKWTTQNSDTIQLKDLHSKVIVLAMIFTNCQAACPRITADMQRIEEGITKAKLKDVQFVLLSMDPARDNPGQLKAFAKDYQLDLNRWVLLTGNSTDVLEISGVLNVRVKEMSDGSFDHSNIIHIINNKGNIIHQQNGLAIDPSESIDVINSML